MESLFTDPYKIESNGLFAKDSTVPDIKDTGSKDDANLSFQLGIPPKFSLPPNAGGLFLRRGMMNAIGKMASAAPFYMGIGYMYTYDSNIAEKIGGYPKGAILRYTDSNDRSHLVESLLENNKVDFRVHGPDGSSWAVITGGSRSFFVNWNSLAVIPLSIKNTGFNNADYSPISGVYKAVKDCVIYASNLIVTGESSTGADIALCVSIDVDDVENSNEVKSARWLPVATMIWLTTNGTPDGILPSTGAIYLKAGTSIALCGIGSASNVVFKESAFAANKYDQSLLCFELAEV
jgi:hypothetical protein